MPKFFDLLLDTWLLSSPQKIHEGRESELIKLKYQLNGSKQMAPDMPETVRKTRFTETNPQRFGPRSHDLVRVDEAGRNVTTKHGDKHPARTQVRLFIENKNYSSS